jgi:valyl-tRNA synthetase
MPYITEELWQRLPGKKRLHAAYADAQPTVMLTAYPEGAANLIDEAAESEMEAIIELISRVRNIRSEMNIKPAERIPIVVASPDENLRRVFSSAREQISRLVRASEVTVNERLEAPKASARAVLAGGAELAVPLEGLIDFEQERRRLQREQEKLHAEATKLEAQLGNPNFVERAPVERVNEVRDRIAAIAQQSSQLQQTVENLQ